MRFKKFVHDRGGCVHARRVARDGTRADERFKQGKGIGIVHREINPVCSKKVFAARRQASAASAQRPTIFSGAMVRSTCIAVCPDGAILSSWTGTSTSRPSESVNNRVSSEAALGAASFDTACDESEEDALSELEELSEVAGFPEPCEQPANARPKQSATAQRIAANHFRFVIVSTVLSLFAGDRLSVDLGHAYAHLVAIKGIDFDIDSVKLADELACDDLFWGAERPHRARIDDERLVGIQKCLVGLMG